MTGICPGESTKETCLFHFHGLKHLSSHISEKVHLEVIDRFRDLSRGLEFEDYAMVQPLFLPTLHKHLQSIANTPGCRPHGTIAEGRANFAHLHAKSGRLDEA